MCCGGGIGNGLFVGKLGVGQNSTYVRGGWSMYVVKSACICKGVSVWGKAVGICEGRQRRMWTISSSLCERGGRIVCVAGVGLLA